MARLRVWIMSGTAGDVNQRRAVAQQMGPDVEITVIPADASGDPLRYVRGGGRVDRAAAIAQLPDVVIGDFNDFIGNRQIYVGQQNIGNHTPNKFIEEIRRLTGGRTKRVGMLLADLYEGPGYYANASRFCDLLIGYHYQNLSLSPSAERIFRRFDSPPTFVTPESLRHAEREWQDTLGPYTQRHPVYAVLVGDPTDHESGASATRIGRAFGQQINRLARDGSVLMTSSRRTDPGVFDLIADAIKVPHYTHAYDENASSNEPNPFQAMLAKADVIVVTGDSMSMISDALATGKPLYILEPSYLGDAQRAYIRRLYEIGAARPYNELLANGPVFTRQMPRNSAIGMAQEVRQITTPAVTSPTASREENEERYTDYLWQQLQLHDANNPTIRFLSTLPLDMRRSWLRPAARYLMDHNISPAEVHYLQADGLHEPTLVIRSYEPSIPEFTLRITNPVASRNAVPRPNTHLVAPVFEAFQATSSRASASLTFELMPRITPLRDLLASGEINFTQAGQMVDRFNALLAVEGYVTPETTMGTPTALRGIENLGVVRQPDGRLTVVAIDAGGEYVLSMDAIARYRRMMDAGQTPLYADGRPVSAGQLAAYERNRDIYIRRAEQLYGDSIANLRRPENRARLFGEWDGIFRAFTQDYERHWRPLNREGAPDYRRYELVPEQPPAGPALPPPLPPAPPPGPGGGQLPPPPSQGALPAPGRPPGAPLEGEILGPNDPRGGPAMLANDPIYASRRSVLGSTASLLPPVALWYAAYGTGAILGTYAAMRTRASNLLDEGRIDAKHYEALTNLADAFIMTGLQGEGSYFVRSRSRNPLTQMTTRGIAGTLAIAGQQAMMMDQEFEYMMRDAVRHTLANHQIDPVQVRALLNQRINEARLSAQETIRQLDGVVAGLSRNPDEAFFTGTPGNLRIKDVRALNALRARDYDAVDNSTLTSFMHLISPPEAPPASQRVLQSMLKDDTYRRLLMENPNRFVEELNRLLLAAQEQARGVQQEIQNDQRGLDRIQRGYNTEFNRQMEQIRRQNGWRGSELERPPAGVSHDTSFNGREHDGPPAYQVAAARTPQLNPSLFG